MGFIMDNKIESNKKIASLESKVDYLEAELSYLNKILVECGFPQGIQSLKSTVEEVLSEGLDQFNPDMT